MVHLRLVTVLTALLGVAGCSTWSSLWESPAERVPTGPPSKEWTRIEREDLGVTFALPDNFQVDDCCVLGSMVTIHAEPVQSPIYGLRLFRYREEQPVFAVEVTVHTVTPWVMGADRGEIADILAKPEDPDTALWLYRRVFAPRMAGLKADKWRNVEVAGRPGISFEAWEQVGREKKNFSRITVVALSAEEALVVQGRFHPKARESDLALYWKIIDSVEAKLPRVTI